MAREVPQRLMPGNDDAGAVFEPWYETCGDIDEAPRAGVADDGDARRSTGANTRAAKSADTTGIFAIPSTAAYGWVAIRYTQGERCGSAKVYFDGRFIESLELYAADGSQQCERFYYLEDHSARKHRSKRCSRAGLAMVTAATRVWIAWLRAGN